MRTFTTGLLAPLPILFVLASCGEDGPSTTAPKDSAVKVTAAVETVPVQNADDAADDPAIWVDPVNPANSVIIGTNKQKGLGIYALDGSELSFHDDGRMNNVDIRQGVTLGAITVDVVAATNRSDQTIALYGFDSAARTLTPLTSPIETGFSDPYGLCLYQNPDTDKLYIFASEADTGVVGQWSLTSSAGINFSTERVRTLTLGTQVEGCVADDSQGVVFIAEEDVGLYAYWADPNVPEDRLNARLVIDTVATGHLTADAEGVTLVDEGNGAGYIIVSSQGSNSYNVYDRNGPYAFRGAFVIGDGANIDGVEETDGIDVTAANLGPRFPGGVFVAQDGFNFDGKDGKKANQNFKLVAWPEIRAALNLPEVAPESVAAEPPSKPQSE